MASSTPHRQSGHDRRKETPAPGITPDAARMTGPRLAAVTANAGARMHGMATVAQHGTGDDTHQRISTKVSGRLGCLTRKHLTKIGVDTTPVSGYFDARAVEERRPPASVFAHLGDESHPTAQGQGNRRMESYRSLAVAATGMPRRARPPPTLSRADGPLGMRDRNGTRRPPIAAPLFSERENKRPGSEVRIPTRTKMS